MKVVKGIHTELRARQCVVTVGTFDGLHLGHKKILDRVKEVADKDNLCKTLVTFEPHPKVVVRPDLAKGLGILTTLDEKISLLEESGIDRLVVIDFDTRFSQMGYESFVKDILLEKLGARVIIVGYDHGFGKNREGNFDKLKSLSQKYRFMVEQIGPIDYSGQVLSSTLVRKLLRAGDVATAQDYLGRRYSISGKVVKGNNRGQEYNYPTANLKVLDPHKLIPLNGVYAVDVAIEKELYKGMLNIGVKPTFGSNENTIETHIFNFGADIYNNDLTIYFKKRLRDEKKFDSVDDLVAQLEMDKKNSLMI